MVTALRTRPSPAIPRQRYRRPAEVEPEQVGQLAQCADDFWYWAPRHAYILDKSRGVHGEYVPFDTPRPFQVEMIDALIAGEWLYFFKSRRPGLTTGAVLYMLWQCQFHPPFNCDAVSKRKEDAQDLIRIYKQAEIKQPIWMQQPLKSDNLSLVEYQSGSSTRVTVGGEGAARSQGIDFLFLDEGAFIRNFEATLKAATPALETSGGNCLVASTSDGPANGFARGWRATLNRDTNFRGIFLSWRAHPDRDNAWHQRTKTKFAHIPNYMKREYPDNWQEALELAGGAVYPHITRETHFLPLKRPKGADLYRGLDFGTDSMHPFVCVWLWHDADGSPSLTFEPDCEVVEQSPLCESKFPYGLEQLFAYRRNEDTGQIIKDHDDVADAIRYVVTYYRLTGHCHVYRVLVIRPDDYFPARPLSCFHRVLELSRWEPYAGDRTRWRPTGKAEEYRGTVGDPNGYTWLAMAEEQQAQGNFDLHFVLYTKPPELRGDPREGGVAWVSALLSNSDSWLLERVKSGEELREERYQRGEPPRDTNERAYRAYQRGIGRGHRGRLLHGYG
jgi:hypothetical protein